MCVFQRQLFEFITIGREKTTCMRAVDYVPSHRQKKKWEQKSYTIFWITRIRVYVSREKKEQSLENQRFRSELKKLLKALSKLN